MSLKLIRVERLKQLATLRRAGGPVELGAVIGRKANQVSDLLSGRAAFGEKVARSIEEAAGLPSGWLDQTDGDASGVAKMESSASYLQPNAINVPVLAAAASMGPGAQQQDGDVIVGKLSLSPTWVSNTLLTLSSPANLRFIHGYGDSMSPTYSDGDMLLVDCGVRNMMVDGIYVLEATQRLFIKRVRQRLDGSFEISSDNATVKTVDILNGDHAVTILGRVVWVWNGRRL